MLSDKVRDDLVSLRDELVKTLHKVKKQAETDLEIDDIYIDSAVLATPRLHNKYNGLFTDHTLKLKDLYAYREKTKLERWKYWNGKQSDKYYAENGLVHEKILKGDIDKYLAADEKMILVNEVVGIQKGIVDYLERCIKEIQTRNFHCKVAVDWRRFTQGNM